MELLAHHIESSAGVFDSVKEIYPDTNSIEVNVAQVFYSGQKAGVLGKDVPYTFKGEVTIVHADSTSNLLFLDKIPKGLEKGDMLTVSRTL